MLLIVDCGASKTDWCVLEGTSPRVVQTPGFNLVQTPPDVLAGILDQAAQEIGPGVDRVHFYAAGLLEKSALDLGRWFPGATIEYASDMLGAARAVCGREPGVAVILGTGANTCSYDGRKIGWKVDSGGFILGDEGSAAVLGRLFVTDFIKKRQPEALSQAFREQFQADYVSLVKHVYTEPSPARYLGSLAPFILSHYADFDYVKELVDNNFRQLFERAILQYDRSLPVGVVGSFGYSCRNLLRQMGEEYGVRFSRFLATPIEGLLQYHAV